MEFFRVECNFGSRYFDDFDEAKAFFDLRKKRHVDVELWGLTTGTCNDKWNCAIQVLLAYSYWDELEN